MAQTEINIGTNTQDVSIGHNSPGNKLDVLFADDSNGAGAIFRNSDGSFELINGNGTADTFTPTMRGTSRGSARGTIFQGNGTAGDDTGTAPLLIFRGSIDEDVVVNRDILRVQNFTTTLLTVNASGDCTLANGDFITESNTYPDYVFDDDYKLMPLDQLKEFITTNGHLPNVPSQEEWKAGGQKIKLNQLSVLLLEKVEELTLYNLQQEEKLQHLQARLDQIEK